MTSNPPHVDNVIDFEALSQVAKQYAGFELADERVLSEHASRLMPHLPKVTDAFYTELQQIDEAKPFLEGRLEGLKRTHQMWLEKIFTGPYDAEFAAYMHKVGIVHVQVKLPEKFMTSGIGLINKHLIPVLVTEYRDDVQYIAPILRAVNAATSYCLMLMQESYRGHELERFMEVTGISRALYDNLAAAYRRKLN
jgi:hypothetical protein